MTNDRRGRFFQFDCKKNIPANHLVLERNTDYAKKKAKRAGDIRRYYKYR